MELSLELHTLINAVLEAKQEVIELEVLHRGLVQDYAHIQAPEDSPEVEAAQFLAAHTEERLRKAKDRYRNRFSDFTAAYSQAQVEAN